MNTVNKAFKLETMRFSVLAATFLGGAPVIGAETESQTRILLTADRPILRAGDRIAIDVLVEDVQDLQTFQVTLDMDGGKRGSLVLEQIVIDESRPEYVFGRGNALEATSVKTREAGVGFASPIPADNGDLRTAPKRRFRQPETPGSAAEDCL